MEDERAWFISQFRKVFDLARCHPVHLRSMEVRWEGSSTKMELDAPRPNENRASFSRWEKRSVISHHFTKLIVYHSYGKAFCIKTVVYGFFAQSILFKTLENPRGMGEKAQFDIYGDTFYFKDQS